MARHLAVLAVFALLVAPLAALAQPSVTYRCTAKDGKKYYGSTIPRQCMGQPIEQLNARGMVVKRMDAEGDARNRAAREEELARKRELDAAAKEVSRRNRALLATYTSEKDIEESRRRSLAENQKITVEVQLRIEGIKKDQVRLTKELEFYQGKNKPPAKLLEELKNTEIDIKAQEDLLAAKKHEVASINAKYDDDRKRYTELTRASSKK